jgi:hypothetical protein
MTFGILKFGSVGDQVRALQNELRKRGYALSVDGWFGEETRTVVLAFQREKGLAQDGIVGSQTLQALGLIALAPKTMPKYLMLHCSATPERSAGVNADQIVRYHMETLKWGRPGYSKIVEYDGRIVNTWDVNLTDGFQPFEITYGAAEWNPISVHICYIGGMDAAYKNPKNTMTTEQEASFAKIIKEVIRQCPDIKVVGHNQVHNKACPSFWVPDFCAKIGISLKNIETRDPFNQRAWLQTL